MDSVDYEYRWQLQAHEALGVMLRYGQKHRLPALMWTIASGTGAIVGEASVLLSTPAEQRAAVVAWAKYLGAKVTEQTGRDGVTYLNAHFKRGKAGLVGGAIRATIYPEDEVS
jgi:hypothetical protein